MEFNWPAIDIVINLRHGFDFYPNSMLYILHLEFDNGNMM